MGFSALAQGYKCELSGKISGPWPTIVSGRLFRNLSELFVGPGRKSLQEKDFEISASMFYAVAERRSPDGDFEISGVIWCALGEELSKRTSLPSEYHSKVTWRSFWGDVGIILGSCGHHSRVMWV